MYDLTISQEYFLCAVNEKGKFSAFDMYGPVCLFAGGLLDFIFSEIAVIDEKKKIQIVGDLTPECQHLVSLYSYIKEHRAKRISNLSSDYIVSDKYIKELIKDVGTSLAEKQCAEPTERGVFGNTVSYAPKAEVVDRVVQKIRAELLENGTVSDSVVALVSLLTKSNSIKKYFSQYEKKQLDNRLKEVKNAPSSKMAEKVFDAVDTILALVTVIIVAS